MDSDGGREEGKRQAAQVMMVMALVLITSSGEGANLATVETSGCKCYPQALQLPCCCCY